MNAVASSAVARTLSFVPTAVATLLTSRLIIRQFGIESFDSFALVLTLINLVPLNNLGVGAAVTSAYAASGPGSEHSRRVTITAARVLLVSTVGTAAAALLIAAFGAWPTLLGTASGPNLYCGLAVVIYAVSFLPGLGQSMLLGVHRNHVTIVVQTFFTPLILAGTVAVSLSGTGGDAVMLVPPSALVVINVVTCALASRSTGIRWRRVLRALPARRRHPGASIRSLSGPVMLITLATPVALQSDRIVLSHVSTAQAVANYSVAMQIIAPAIALIAASAQPLWPIYARARAEGGQGPRLVRLLAAFGAAAALVGAALALVANPVGELIGGARIDLGWALPIVGGLVVVTAALSYPVAMSLMDPDGVRVVAFLTVLALPLNLGLSIVLGRSFGAPGPWGASVVIGLAVQTMPAVVYSNRRHGAGRHRKSRAVADRTAADPQFAAVPALTDTAIAQSGQTVPER